MRYGIACWNYEEEGKPLCELVAEFADMGFTAISFVQRQIVGLTAGEADDLRSLLESRDLIATVHGACGVSSEHVRMIVERLGTTLRTFTVDPLMKTDSRGSFYDVPSLITPLEELSRLSDRVLFAIEDFPLDTDAVSFYEESLAGLLANPNYGILVDVGHMNFRRQRDNSGFKGMSPLEYLSRIPLPIIEAHIHDNMGDKDSHGHFGFGNVDFPAVARALKEVGFDGISTIEIAPSFHGSTPTQSKPFARQSLDIWRSLWESLPA
jgi:sugar phosphate isomerase/epimerase